MSENLDQPQEPNEPLKEAKNKPWGILKDELGRPLYHRDFVDFLANPFDKRTYAQFCTDVGIVYTTLYRYQRAHRVEISKDVEKARMKFISDMRSEAYKILTEKMKKDTNALKLFFQLSGDLVERTESRVEMMTPEEKREKARKLFADLKSNSVVNQVYPEDSDGSSPS